MTRHPEAVMAAKVGYRLPEGLTWDAIAHARAKYSIQPRSFPLATVHGVATGWGVPTYEPNVAARVADLLRVAAFQRRQLGVSVTSEHARAGLMADSLYLLIRARRLRLTGFEHEKGRSADQPQADALMDRIVAREMGQAA